MGRKINFDRTKLTGVVGDFELLNQRLPVTRVECLSEVIALVEDNLPNYRKNVDIDSPGEPLTIQEFCIFRYELDVTEQLADETSDITLESLAVLQACGLLNVIQGKIVSPTILGLYYFESLKI